MSEVQDGIDDGFAEGVDVMTIESWQVATRAAELYEKRLVPALMAAWAPRTIEAARIRQGDRVLDVACGTGIVARAAAERAGDAGQVVGLDLNPGMLAVANRLQPKIEWRQGDATALPFADASFDRVLCQFGLMFFPGRPAALREMHRVLKPGGRLAVATWDAIEISPPYVRQAEIVERLAGPEAAAIVRAPFVLADPAELERMLAAAGFESVKAETVADVITYPNVDAVLEGEIDATPLGTFLQGQNTAIYDHVKTELREALTPFVTRDGVVYPTAAHIVSGRRA